MTSEFSATAEPTTAGDRISPRPVTATEARDALDLLMAQVGVDGLVEALTHPGLMARVDQHAAAVRDAVTTTGGIDELSLARYARSIVAAAERVGRPLGDPADIDWPNADWHVLRLVAVCALADEFGLL
jgi:hypothetical protein